MAIDVGGWLRMPDDLFIKGDGPRLAVRDFGGDGPPIVLVHGHYGNLASFDFLGPLLARGLHVVAYDQRGHGWSEAGPVGIREFVQDLADVVDVLGLDRPILYGSSFGTLIVLAYLAAGGDGRAFITEDGHLSDFPPEPTVEDPPAKPHRVLSDGAWSTYLDGFSAAGPTGEATAWRSAVRRRNGTEVVPSAVDIHTKERAFVRLPVLDAYRSVRCPVLALLARQRSDLAARHAEVDALAEIIELETVWFDTGHWISAEATEALADEVLHFAGPLQGADSVQGQ